MPAWKNQLYYGDNLDVLRRHVADESVDLVYLDPPFNSNADYNVLFAEQDGTRSAAQIKAFGDTWTWDQAAARAFEETVELGGSVSLALQAFRTFLGENDVLAYLSMMAPRLVELRRVLKDTGSIYLHCDPTASHYLKMLMDAVFGPTTFRNEVIWWYRKWTKPPQHFLRNHNVLLFYAKGDHNQFNVLSVPLAPSTLRRFGGKKQKFADEERTRKVTDDEESAGAPRPDVWPINLIPAQSAERLGYPTQKPIRLLEVVIEASSNPGDVVLDPFCGCGTTLAAAQLLDRRWIGIDITHLAVNLIRHRMLDTYGTSAEFDVIGEPASLADAQALADSDPYQFQWWALGLVGARPAEGKKGADKGIDGRLFFHDPPGSGRTQQVIISVKAGNTGPAHVRDLRGVIDREKAAVGVLISMNSPTAPMRSEAASAGFYASEALDRSSHPRLQLLSISDLLADKRIDLPAGGYGNVTYRKAEAAKAPGPEVDQLTFDD